MIRIYLQVVMKCRNASIRLSILIPMFTSQPISNLVSTLVISNILWFIRRYFKYFLLPTNPVKRRSYQQYISPSINTVPRPTLPRTNWFHIKPKSLLSLYSVYSFRSSVAQRSKKFGVHTGFSASGSHLLFGDESGVSERVVIGVVQRQALTQLSEQHGHLLHAPPATHQHHLGCHPVALTAWSQHTHTHT